MPGLELTTAQLRWDLWNLFAGGEVFRDWALLELELIQTQMTQKPMLRAEVYARALRASQNRKEDSL